jgi:hypothetical protein
MKKLSLSEHFNSGRKVKITGRMKNFEHQDTTLNFLGK